MERIETPEELATWITTGNKTMEYVRGLITARDAAIRAEAADRAGKYFESVGLYKDWNMDELRAAICRKEVVG